MSGPQESTSINDVPLDAIEEIKRGAPLLKYGRRGDPHFRHFQLSGDGLKLIWFSPKKKKEPTQVLIADIRELRRGQKTDVFRRQLKTEFEHLSFSLIYKAPNSSELQSLDIVCKDLEEYDTWTTALHYLITMRERSIPIAGYSTMFSGDANEMKHTEIHASDLRDTMKDHIDVYTWGFGGWGELGHGEKESPYADRPLPAIIQPLMEKDVNSRDVSCGAYHTAVVASDGHVWTWGNAGCGKLGNNSKEIAPLVFEHQPSPVRVFGLEAKKVSAVACGDFHTLCLTKNGLVFSWGSGAFGQLGHGNDQDFVNPIMIQAFGQTQITKIAAGHGYSAAIDSTNLLYTWGWGNSGKLGHGNEEDVFVPTTVESLRDYKVKMVACGDLHTAAIAVEYATNSLPIIFTWGWNECGQLGHGDFEDRYSPERVVWMDGKNVKEVDCGAAHTAAVVVIQKLEMGQVFAWGSSTGAVGNPTQENLNVPLIVQALSSSNIERIACGAHHSVALSESGDVYVWGYGGDGQLGLSQHSSYGSPTLVQTMLDKEVVSIASGGRHVAALVSRKWMSDEDHDSCLSCKLQFTVVRRRHHCRNCGGLFCGKCTNKRYPVLKLGYTEPVRVCNICYDKLSR